MPTTTTYKLGRDAIASLPGLDNEDIRDATINVSADELDVTTFKAQPITHSVIMAGLVDITIDVPCVKHTAAIGDRDTADIAGFQNIDAVVLDIKQNVTPRGIVEFTISYGVIPSDV